MTDSIHDLNLELEVDGPWLIVKLTQLADYGESTISTASLHLSDLKSALRDLDE